MNRQSASRKTFGMVMVIVALLLAACGNGDGDSAPTPTSGANQAVPTLPSDDATAAATDEISEDDLTVVTPNLPATQGDGITDLTGESTPDAEGTPTESGETDVAPDETAATGTATLTGTPASEVATDSTTPATPDVATQVLPGETADASPPATVSGATFNTAGDGTGGSGQPGERDSNTGNPLASPAASPVAAVEVDGCEVTTVPPFTGTTNAYVTNAEVFFRQGPGTDCTPVYEAPLGEGQAVEVIGGPVSQATDGTIWVQVEVDGVPGWVSFDLVEPAG
jgi:hypothetical protein